MCDFIKRNFQGATVTVAITGLPITITGEVIASEEHLLGLRLENGNKIFINGCLIAFVF